MARIQFIAPQTDTLASRLADAVSQAEDDALMGRAALYTAWVESELDEESAMDAIIEELLH